jgi:hypothetical protein
MKKLSLGEANGKQVTILLCKTKGPAVSMNFSRNWRQNVL